MGKMPESEIGWVNVYISIGETFLSVVSPCNSLPKISECGNRKNK